MICKEGEGFSDDEEPNSPIKKKKLDPYKVDKKYLYPHGVAAPLKNCRKRRFRKRDGNWTFFLEIAWKYFQFILFLQSSKNSLDMFWLALSFLIANYFSYLAVVLLTC